MRRLHRKAKTAAAKDNLPPRLQPSDVSTLLIHAGAGVDWKSPWILFFH